MQIDKSPPNSINISMQITMCAVVVCFYFPGVYLHSKIISSSRKNEQVTWKLDVTNSFFLIFFFGSIIVINGLTIFVKDLYLYTGSWFCYAYKMFTVYGRANITGHSFIIALMKYVLIVQYQRVQKFGEENIKRIFYWINVIFPIYIIGMFAVIRPDALIASDGVAFGASSANRCLGKSDIVSSLRSNKTAIELHNICGFASPHNMVSMEYMVYVGNVAVCWTHAVILALNSYNIPEIFLYCLIFRFMWK